MKCRRYFRHCRRTKTNERQIERKEKKKFFSHGFFFVIKIHL
jgi:hypothetical protein